MRGRSTKLARCIPLAFLVGAALLIAPAGASAAATIGETFTPNLQCPGPGTSLQSISPGAQYAAPSPGVITSWSFRAAATAPSLKFKVGRAAPGADLTTNADFTIVGESAPVTPATGTLNTYSTRIPVLAGDLIGLGVTIEAPNCRVATGYTLHFKGPPDVPPGTTNTFTPVPNAQLDVSALLEPDCDKDGLGDETQDGNLSSCGPGASTPRTCRGQRLTIVGTPGDDVIVGTAGRDVIAALSGNDDVFGLRGNDLICGNSGKDKIRGQSGNDTLKGNYGRDTLRGGRGNDTLRGGHNHDTCFGGRGNDSFSSC